MVGLVFIISAGMNISNRNCGPFPFGRLEEIFRCLLTRRAKKSHERGEAPFCVTEMVIIMKSRSRNHTPERRRSALTLTLNEFPVVISILIALTSLATNVRAGIPCMSTPSTADSIPRMHGRG